MKITITGNLGSGKSTVAKILSKKLGLKRYSVGDFMGELAMEKGLSLMELSYQAERNKSIDETLDKKQIDFGKEHNNFILDSRLGWYFIPDSFKLFLKCDIDEATRRVFRDPREDEKENVTFEATKKNLLRRVKSERQRYRAYYDLDSSDEKHYDLVIDTTSVSAEEVVDKIISKIEELQKI